MFSQCLADLCEIRVLVVHPAHAGFGCIRRQRLYVVMYLRSMVRRLQACVNRCMPPFAGWRRAPLFSGVFMAGTADLLVEENRAGG